MDEGLGFGSLINWGILERIMIRAYYVDHVWISEKVNLDEGDHFLCSMVKEE